MCEKNHCVLRMQHFTLCLINNNYVWKILA